MNHEQRKRYVIYFVLLLSVLYLLLGPSAHAQTFTFRVLYGQNSTNITIAEATQTWDKAAAILNSQLGYNIRRDGPLKSVRVNRFPLADFQSGTIFPYESILLAEEAKLPPDRLVFLMAPPLIDPQYPLIQWTSGIGIICGRHGVAAIQKIKSRPKAFQLLGGVYLVAHEMGHNMGMLHDWLSNSIMNPSAFTPAAYGVPVLGLTQQNYVEASACLQRRGL